MGILDFIKNLFSNGKTNTKIITKDFEKVYKDDDKLEIGLYDTNKNPLSDKDILININDVDYIRKTDTDGIARLNINLMPGVYKAYVKFKGDDGYNQSTGYANVYVNANIETQDLNMNYKDGSKFIAKIKDKDNNAISNVKVIFTVNGSNYERISDENGIISLNINLSTGKYDIITQVGNNKVKNVINIDKDVTRMEGTDVNMVYKDGTKYQCAVYSSNNVRVNGKVSLIINGIEYQRLSDNEGLYKLNLNLNPGTYTIKAIFNGDINYKKSEITNTIKINEPPKTQEYKSLYGYLTGQGCSQMGQCNGYYCACNSLQQAFYRMTGIHVSESTIASVAGTTTAGTDHEGINTAVTWFNRKYNENIKITWKNFSDLGNNQSERFAKLQELINNGAVFIHLLYRDKYGHYEVPYKVYDSKISVLNSLGEYCSYPAYCGYIETRSFDVQQSYINGISQKSIAIFSR